MISRLIEALGELDPPLSPRELADALWLASLLPLEESARASSPRAQEPPPGPVPEASTGPAERPGDPVVGEPKAPVPSRIPQAGLYLAGKESPSTPFSIRSPAVPALPGALHLSRALRPLRVRTSSSTHREMDEASTARHVAETGVWEPVMRPSPERWLDLALVVDTGPSMVVWGRIVEELQTLLERLGAFRDVRAWRMDTGGEPLTLDTGASPGGAGHSPDELIDATRRRVILVVSDCIGASWRDGRAAALLDRWGRAGPLAILQPLPQRLWWRSGAAIEPVRLSAAARGASNDRLIVRMGETGQPVPPGIPVPVMELAPRWLGPWSSMIADAGGDITGAALFTGRPVTDEAPPDRPDEDWPPVVRVTRFRAASSPTAFALAGYLAAAPLRLRVMRLVQRAMLPESTPAHLAEVFLGGLLRMVGAEDEGDRDDVAYEFHDGVREVLLGSLSRGEALRVLREVWEVVRDRFGSALDFPALLRAIQRDNGELPFDKPFAQVAAPVLASLGGRYAELADRLTTTIGTETGPGTVRAPSAPPPVEGPPVPRPAPAIWGRMPQRNPDFTGRDDLLLAVRDALGDSATALLPRRVKGLGGEGKSQLAVEYAHRYAHEYDLVWWIPAEQAPLARSALANLARRLGTPLSDDIKGTVENVLNALRAGSPHRRWLLIYDNAAEPGEVVPLMPLAGDEDGRPLRTPYPTGHVLITSRDRAWEDQAAAIEVTLFDRAETISFLRRRAPDLTAREAGRLAERVGDLPLAVEQAAAWQVATGGGVREYLRLFDRRLEELPGRNPAAHLPRRLAVTTGLNLDRLRAGRPVAGRLLDLWAFFGPEPVPAGLLSAGGGAAALPADLAEVMADEDALRETMETIAGLALGRFDRSTSTLQVHRLLRDLLQAGLPVHERDRVRGHVHTVLAAATPDEPPGNETTWERRAEISPHVVPAGLIEGDAATRNVALDQSQFLFYAGDFEGSRHLAQFALDRWRTLYGADDPSTLDAGRVLANALRLLGDISNAARLSEDTWRRMRERLGEDHPSTLFAANGFGADLRLRGNFIEAQTLDQDTWERMRRLFQGDHPYTWLVANNVAIGLRVLGRFDEAYDVDSEALRWLHDQEAPPYLDIYRATHNLARDLHGLGRYREALGLQRANLLPRGHALSSDNVLVLQAKMSHAGTLRECGEFEAAERLAAETYEAHVRRFGEEHPSTIAAKISLAIAGIRAGSRTQAPLLIQEALASYRHVLGADHPFARACAATLGVARRALGDVRGALTTDQATLEAIRTGPLGPDHHYALCCAVGLANDLYLLHRPVDAARLSQRTLAVFQRRYGPDHPYSLACAHNDAMFRRAAGEPAPGGDGSETALARVLGEGHPHARAAARGELLECLIEPTPL